MVVEVYHRGESKYNLCDKEELVEIIIESQEPTSVTRYLSDIISFLLFLRPFI